MSERCITVRLDNCWGFIEGNSKAHPMTSSQSKNHVLWAQKILLSNSKFI